MDVSEYKFREIIGQNHERIFRICAYHSNGLDDCKDLYQQVLINIWKSLKNFRGEAQISTWIYRIALNTAFDFGRSESRRQQAANKFREEMYHNSAIYNSSWEKIRKEMLLDELVQQINQLSVIDKIIISLVLEEISSKEISEIVGITEPNVRVKIHRIKETLKLKMGRENHE